MAWDSSRPVDWNRLLKEWMIYAAIMVVIFLVLFRDRPLAGVFGGVVFSLPLYLGLGYVLAKFGFQRDRIRRSAAATSTEASSSRRTNSNDPRPRPAPTKRTGGGTPRSNRPKTSVKKRR